MIAFVLSNKQSEPHRHTWRDSTLIPLNSLVVWRWSVTTRRHPEPDQSSRRYPLFKVLSPPDCYNKLLDTNQLLLCVSGTVSTLAVYQSNNRMKNKSNPRCSDADINMQVMSCGSFVPPGTRTVVVDPEYDPVTTHVFIFKR